MKLLIITIGIILGIAIWRLFEGIEKGIDNEIAYQRRLQEIYRKDFENYKKKGGENQIDHLRKSP